jgi:hypothetical protein
MTEMLAFVAHPNTTHREVRVNFGVFAGRAVTAAEIDELAKTLVPELGAVTIVSEERHELSTHSEVSVHLVRIELPDEADADRMVALAEQWAQACIDDRHADVVDQ